MPTFFIGLCNNISSSSHLIIYVLLQALSKSQESATDSRGVREKSGQTSTSKGKVRRDHVANVI